MLTSSGRPAQELRVVKTEMGDLLNFFMTLSFMEATKPEMMKLKENDAVSDDCENACTTVTRAKSVVKQGDWSSTNFNDRIKGFYNVFKVM